MKRLCIALIVVVAVACDFGATALHFPALVQHGWAEAGGWVLVVGLGALIVDLFVGDD